jgi:hypothetical protein
MNDENKLFDELLSAALEDCVHDQPRPGLDRRILASLPTRRLPMRWALWAPLATASALALAAISLHVIHRPSAAPSAIASVPRARPIPGTVSVASPARTLPARTLPSPHSRTQSRLPAAIIPPAEVTATHTVPTAPESQPSRQQTLPDFAQADASTQTPPPATSANGEVKINPIQIAPLDISPLPGAEAASQSIPPIHVEPIEIAPIEISKLEIDPPNSNP